MPVVTEKVAKEMVEEWGRLTSSIAPKMAKAKKLKDSVFKFLRKTNRTLTLEGETAIAKRVEKYGDREIRVDAFLAAAQSKTEEERLACLKVEIAKAEALLGKDLVSKIANRPTVQSNSLELKT